MRLSLNAYGSSRMFSASVVPALRKVREERGIHFVGPAGEIQNPGHPAIIINLVVVIIAALNLVVDFDFVKQCARSDLPRYMEWYTALGLIVTLVWLYLEILRLMAKARKAEQGR